MMVIVLRSTRLGELQQDFLSMAQNIEQLFAFIFRFPPADTIVNKSMHAAGASSLRISSSVVSSTHVEVSVCSPLSCPPTLHPARPPSDLSVAPVRPRPVGISSVACAPAASSSSSSDARATRPREEKEHQEDGEHAEEKRHPAAEKDPKKLYTTIAQNPRIISTCAEYCAPFVHANSWGRGEK